MVSIEYEVSSFIRANFNPNLIFRILMLVITGGLKSARIVFLTVTKYMLNKEGLSMVMV